MQLGKEKKLGKVEQGEKEQDRKLKIYCVEGKRESWGRRLSEGKTM